VKKSGIFKPEKVSGVSSILFAGTIIFVLITLGCTGDLLEPGASDSGLTGTEGADVRYDGTDDQGIQAGTITAAEWNDLDNWSQWDSLVSTENYVPFPGYWQIFPRHRVSVQLVGDNSVLVNDARVELIRDNTTIWITRSDNFGKAELWVDLFQSSEGVDWSEFQLSVNGGAVVSGSVRGFDEGLNTLIVPSPGLPSDRVEIAFVVDATGSMGDELEFLKVELLDVIDSVRMVNVGANLLTGAVFYRDVDDQYVTRTSAFNTDDAVTLDFIEDQSAGGGGDYPEAVHTALDRGINDLQWSTSSKARLMFLLLDAPPHYQAEIVNEIHTYIQAAAAKGIKIIPITASGVNKETEFLMRLCAISTNGTYVFITNDSGVGNDHIDPSVGEYQVELLNHLMVRLINKYIN